MKLGINLDHVTTLRQARYRDMLDSPNAEPVLRDAIEAAQKGGADSITIHLRLDRRHIQDEDVFLTREVSPLPLNLEMGNSGEILTLALKAKPDFVCLVPENRQEITTEGGLDVVGEFEALRATVSTLREAGMLVSMFVDPEIEQIEASKELNAEMIELHTGSFANAHEETSRGKEIERLQMAAEKGSQLGLQVNAGHGINYINIEYIKEVPHLEELNIGHAIVARSVFVGLEIAVREMRELM